MTFRIERCCVALLLLPLGFGVAQAQLRGHGGPVRALAISPDGSHAVSGSFDTSTNRWSLTRNVAEQVMRFHDGAVKEGPGEFDVHIYVASIMLANVK
jgi:cytochrome c